jgi:hypothetical protein
MSPDVKTGAIAVSIGLLLLGLGIFTMGDRGGRVTGSAYVLGLVLLCAGVPRLLRAGWHGSGRSWIIAAGAAALAWALYELIRQSVPLYGIGIYGEMTAPILSTAVAVGTILAGWLRGTRLPSDISRAD